MIKFYFFSFLLFCSATTFGQTKGLIYKPSSTVEGRNVLDPNGDGYTSQSPMGFLTNDWGSGPGAESEIVYQPIPILENEPIQGSAERPGLRLY